MSRFLWKIGLLSLSNKKCGFCNAKLLIKHSGNMFIFYFFVLDLIQIIINIVTLGYRPNIHWNWARHFSKNSFNLGWKMMVWELLLECVAIKTLFRLKITWNGLTSIASEQGTVESKPKVDGISFKPTSTTKHEFNDSTSSAWGIWESKPKVDGISSTACEFGNSLSSTSLGKDTLIIFKKIQIVVVKVRK